MIRDLCTVFQTTAAFESTRKHVALFMISSSSPV
jgi:hypothetical protein